MRPLIGKALLQMANSLPALNRSVAWQRVEETHWIVFGSYRPKDASLSGALEPLVEIVATGLIAAKAPSAVAWALAV